MYTLSRQFLGHEQDVKAVATSGSTIYSASRDGTVREWNSTSKSNAEAAQYRFHTGFVNSLAANSTFFVSGGQDHLINAIQIGDERPALVMLDHADNVCSLALTPTGDIISGSWDGTARLWTEGRCVALMEGHTGAVWAVLWTSYGILTGGADRTIRLWKDGKQQKNYATGKDCVRSLALHPLGFVSAGNDSIIRVHSFEGDVLQQLEGHESFIYSLATDAHGCIFSAGEDRTLRIWRNGKLQQTIVHPAVSVWSVALLVGGDVVTGASDAVVRVFTASEDRRGSPEELKQFEDSVASSAIPAQTHNIPNNLPGLEALSRPGDKEGDVKMIRVSPEIVEAHQWSGGVWVKIGEVIGASSKQVEYEGKQWDFVFDVDVAEGLPPLKLPYNTDENPYEAANRFIEKYELDIGFQGQVVKFIESNTGGVPLGVPKSTPTQAAPQNKASNTTPQTKYLAMIAGNITPIVNKLKSLYSEHGTSSIDIAPLDALDPARPLSTHFEILLELVQSFSRDHRFPALDLLRLCVHKIPQTVDIAKLVNIVIQAGELESSQKDKTRQTNTMLALRCLANLYTTPRGEAYLQQDNQDEPINAITGIDFPSNKNLSTALSTYLLNVNVSACRSSSTQVANKTIAPLLKLISTNSDSEVQYRALVALGTALRVSVEVVQASKDVLDVPQALSQLATSEESRIKDLLKEIHGLLI